MLINDEYEALFRPKGTCAKEYEVDDSDLMVRKSARHYVAIAANSGVGVRTMHQVEFKSNA